MAKPGAAWTELEAVLDKRGVEFYKVTLTIRLHKEDEQWSAWCEELDVHTCGDNLDEATRNVINATICYLNTIEELGERARIFEERGIQPQLWVPETDPSVSAVRTDVEPGEFVTHLVAASEREDLQPA